METNGEKTERLDELPDQPLTLIAKAGNVSTAGVEGSAKRLGIQLIRNPTGRQSARPHDAVTILRELRRRAGVHPA